jgi:hypothetical protein
MKEIIQNYLKKGKRLDEFKSKNNPKFIKIIEKKKKKLEKIKENWKSKIEIENKKKQEKLKIVPIESDKIKNIKKRKIEDPGGNIKKRKII